MGEEVCREVVKHGQLRNENAHIQCLAIRLDFGFYDVHGVGGRTRHSQVAEGTIDINLLNITPPSVSILQPCFPSRPQIATIMLSEEHETLKQHPQPG